MQKPIKTAQKFNFILNIQNVTNHLCVLLLLLVSTSIYAADDTNANTDKPTNTSTGETLPPTSQSDTPKATDETTQTKPNVNVQRAIYNERNKMNKRQREVLDYLKLYQRQQEMVKLSSQGQEFYGFFLQERSGQPQGAVLILHDIEQHAHWPKLVAPLRENLPDNGWVTLSIELAQTAKLLSNQTTKNNKNEAETADKAQSSQEQQPVNPPQAAQESQEQKAEQSVKTDTQNEPTDSQMSADNEPALPKLGSLPKLPTSKQQNTSNSNAETPPLKQYQQQMEQRIDAALTYLKSRGQFNLVIIGMGQAAVWAANASLKLDKKEGLALVLINAKADPNQDGPLTDKLAKLELPILDLLTDENQSSPYQLTQRQGTMRHLERTNYTQIYLPQRTQANAIFAEVQATRQPHPVVRRIRGWLRSKAAGTPLKLPRSQSPKKPEQSPKSAIKNSAPISFFIEKDNSEKPLLNNIEDMS